MIPLTEIDRTSVLRRAAVRATRAPSVHNTQPWRFRLRRDELLLYADRSRQLTVLDPGARQLTVSCGCALLNARASVAASGLGAEVERFPDPAEPDLLARITVTGPDDEAGELADLDPFVDLRHTNRRRFSAEQVPADTLDALARAAAREGGALHVVTSEEHRLAVAVLGQRADAIENADPAYRAEIRAWTTDGRLHRADGVSASTIPHVDGSSQDEVPLRDFDTRGSGELPAVTGSSHQQTMVLVGTPRDLPMDWLTGGEAVERVLLELTRLGFVASPITQVIEVSTTRASLRAQLGLTDYPQILLRVGLAPLAPASRRRRLVDVLAEDG